MYLEYIEVDHCKLTFYKLWSIELINSQTTYDINSKSEENGELKCKV